MAGATARRGLTPNKRAIQFIMVGGGAGRREARLYQAGTHTAFRPVRACAPARRGCQRLVFGSVVFELVLVPLPEMLPVSPLMPTLPFGLGAGFDGDSVMGTLLPEPLVMLPEVLDPVALLVVPVELQAARPRLIRPARAMLV